MLFLDNCQDYKQVCSQSIHHDALRHSRFPTWYAADAFRVFGTHRGAMPFFAFLQDSFYSLTVMCTHLVAFSPFHGFICICALRIGLQTWKSCEVCLPSFTRFMRWCLPMCNLRRFAVSSIRRGWFDFPSKFIPNLLWMSIIRTSAKCFIFYSCFFFYCFWVSVKDNQKTLKTFKLITSFTKYIKLFKCHG